jgi:hypothetical protein
MKTIHKYRLPASDVNELFLPENAEILCIQMQDDRPHLWAMVDPEKPVKKRLIVEYTTGQLLTDAKRTYIGTVQYKDGIVLHFFETTTP